MSIDPTKRFSNRVNNYSKYRPSYPKVIIRFFTSELGLLSSHVIADIGSGTGLFTELLLKNGNVVYAVEPNDDMRRTGEKQLKRYTNFKSINGTAENTTLSEKSVDFITCAQSFHWFNLSKTKREFLRILKPNGWVVLIWNNWEPAKSVFLDEYDKLIRKYSAEYKKVKSTWADEYIIRKLFGNRLFRLRSFPNEQVLNFKGLKGRLLSASYIPSKEDSQYNCMIKELHNVFDKCNINGRIKFEYDTLVYYGQL